MDKSGKRKAAGRTVARNSKKQKQPVDFNYDSDDLSSDGLSVADAPAEEEEEIVETADEKRIRLAKQYLAAIGASTGDGEADEAVVDALEKDVLANSSAMFKAIGSQLLDLDISSSVDVWRGHQLPATCVTITEAGASAWTGSKDCSITWYDVETGKRKKFGGRRRTKADRKRSSASANWGIDGHWEQVLALAVSSDGKYLASGGADHMVRIWDTRTHSEIDTFKGHRSAVTGAAFRHGTHTLYTCGRDRTAKVWGIDEKAFIDNLFGHQADALGLDCLQQERVLVSGEDRTVRLFKIADESQLVFRGHRTGGAIETCAMISDKYFTSGCADGTLALWSLMKKKPIDAAVHSHGAGNGVAAVASLRNSDVIASGSCDGYVRLWQVDKSVNPARPRLKAINAAAVPGFVNDLAWSRSGNVLACAVGTEPRLGRWEHSSDKAVRNGIAIIRLPAFADTALWQKNGAARP